MSRQQQVEAPAFVPPNVEPFVFDDLDIDPQLYQDSFANLDEKSVVLGKVVGKTKDFIIVDVGFKSEGKIPIAEFGFNDDNPILEMGEEVEVYIEAYEEKEDGQTQLSKIKAVKLRTWAKIGEIFEKGETVEGTIINRIKGGLSVDVGVKAFLPGSQIDLRPVKNMDSLLGETFEFKILKYDNKRSNIVLSRRALLEVDRDKKRLETLKVLEENAVITGHVKNITDYGVFIDLGGVDGLLHITDITWGRIVHPSEMFAIGDEVEVLVLKYDADDQKVSLGLKQKTANPWESVATKYSTQTKVLGKIVSLTDYGAFIELEPGVEGLIHVSEMSWTKKIRNPSKLVTMGQEVEAIVKELDVERKRISLSMREIEPNPWEIALEKYPIGSMVDGTVRNVTDFGIFVGLDDEIDGLVHVSDISWSQRQKKPSEIYKKGDTIEVKVLNIDVEKERLSLGIKQLDEDPWKNLDEKFELSSEVSGKIVNITDFGIFVEVLEGVEGLIHISEIDQSIPKGKMGDFYPLGTDIHARVIKIDPEERRLGLSIIDDEETSEAVVAEEATSETPVETSSETPAPSTKTSTDDET